MEFNVQKLLRPETVMSDFEESISAQNQPSSGFDLGKFLLGLLFTVIFWFVLSYVIQWAWNASIPEAFSNVGPLSQKAALAMVILVQLLSSRIRM